LLVQKKVSKKEEKGKQRFGFESQIPVKKKLAKETKRLLKQRQIRFYDPLVSLHSLPFLCEPILPFLKPLL